LLYVELVEMPSQGGNVPHERPRNDTVTWQDEIFSKVEPDGVDVDPESAESGATKDVRDSTGD
jgi:hypothetical protein